MYRAVVVAAVAVRDGVVPAVRAVGVPLLVPGAVVGRGAGVGVGGVHRQRVLADSAVRLGAVQVAVVQVGGVPVMLRGRVPAVGAVALVRVRVRRVLVSSGWE
jgi:hypothetical protein